MKNNQNHSNKRIRIEELPRQHPYRVPEGYFDKLPARISEQIHRSPHQPAWRPRWSPAWQLALPLVTLVLMVAYFGLRLQKQDIDVQAMLDEVPTEVLVGYLEESDISTEELISMVNLEELDLDALLEEEIRLLDDSELDILLEEYPEEGWDWENKIM